MVTFRFAKYGTLLVSRALGAQVREELLAELAKGEKVALAGLGVFEVRNRVARNGRNPRTGEDIVVPAQKTPAFRAGKLLKDAVNK